MNDFLLVAPLLFLVFGGLLVMLLDSFSEMDSGLPVVTTVVLVIAGTISAFAMSADIQVATPDYVLRYLAVDKFGLFFDVVICAGAALSTLLAAGYLREHGLERGEFYILILFSALGAMVLARANDLITLFIGLETMSLGAYALCAYRRGSARAVEGAVKYFLLGSFAAAILLFGSAILYGATGHTDFAGITEVITSGKADAKLVLLSMLMMVVGLTFKVSAVPFHMWTPDAYEGAVTPATTFMSVAVKAAAFAVLVRVLLGIYGDTLSMSAASGWPPAIAGIAAITMVFGNLAAINQSNVKRMLAYSSIAHAGYLLVGVVAAFRNPEAGVSSVLFYLLAYTVSNALAFGSLILMGSRGREVVSYEDLAGVGQRHPMLALPFVIAVLSLMGFPPTGGFFAKYYVFNAAVQAGGGMVWLAILGVLTSAVGAYYYLKVIVYMFMKEPQTGAPIAIPMRSSYVAAALVLSGYYVLKMGLTPTRYLDMAINAASQFVG